MTSTRFSNSVTDPDNPLSSVPRQVLAEASRCGIRSSHFCASGMDAATPRLNLLVITADDLNGNTPGWMGDKHGATPELDRFAATAHRFVNCHLTAPICQPSRSALMTGRVPHRNGALGFHPIKPGTPTLVKLLQAHGYYAAVMNKHPHMKPDSEFPWDARFDGSSKAPARWNEQMAQAMKAAAEAGKPFFINANITDPHRPFPDSADVAEEAETPAEKPGKNAARKNAAAATLPAKVFAAKDVTVPSFLEDLPKRCAVKLPSTTRRWRGWMTASSTFSTRSKLLDTRATPSSSSSVTMACRSRFPRPRCIATAPMSRCCCVGRAWASLNATRNSSAASISFPHCLSCSMCPRPTDLMAAPGCRCCAAKSSATVTSSSRTSTP